MMSGKLSGSLRMSLFINDRVVQASTGMWLPEYPTSSKRGFRGDGVRALTSWLGDILQLNLSQFPETASGTQNSMPDTDMLWVPRKGVPALCISRTLGYVSEPTKGDDLEQFEMGGLQFGGQHSSTGKTKKEVHAISTLPVQVARELDPLISVSETGLYGYESVTVRAMGEVAILNRHTYHVRTQVGPCKALIEGVLPKVLEALEYDGGAFESATATVGSISQELRAKAS